MTRNIEQILAFLKNDGSLQGLSIEELGIYEKHLTIEKIKEEENWETNKLEQWYKDNPDKAPQDKLGMPRGETKGGSDSGMAVFANYFQKKHETYTSASGYEVKAEDVLKDTRFQCYDNGWAERGIEGLWINADSDTGCEDIVSDWSPADNYAKMVWNTFVCKADLFKIAIKGISVNAGDGLGVQIRVAGPFQAPTELASCECASCASITFSTYPITLKQYNLEAIVCGKDAFDVGDALMESYVIAMGNSWAKYFDQEIYDAIEEASPGTTKTLPAALDCTASITGSCCTDSSLVNIWNAVNRAVASMREGTGLAGPYDPDTIIISPSVAEIFKRMQTPTSQFASASIQFDSEGRVKKIGGLKVIEYCGANPCSTDQGEAIAVIVDSRRAVGAAFGMRPKMWKFFQSNCNSTRIDFWSYFGVAACDLDAIAHIVNP